MLINISLPNIWFANIFSHCLFILLINHYAGTMLAFVVLLIWRLCFWCHSQKIFAKTNVEELFPHIFFWEFLGLMFKSLIYFELIFVMVWDSFACECLVFSAPLLEETSSFHWVFLAHLSNIRYPCVHGLFMDSYFCCTGFQSIFMPVPHHFNSYSFVI